MVDQSRIDALYDSTLKPRLDAMEGLRLSLKGHLSRAFRLIGVPFLIFISRDLLTFVLPGWVVTLVGVVSFACIIVGVVLVLRFAMAGLTAYANYTARFKHEIVSEIFKAICPTATYDAHQGIPAAVFDSPGIFSTQGSLMSDDRVRGHIGRTPFEAGEVHRHYSSSGGEHSHSYDVFHGLFFHFDFNKALRGVTIVQPEGAPAHQLGERKGLAAVSLEDPEFARAFKVYGSSEVEARYVLTPAMMERLRAVRAEAGKPVFLGFKNAGAYLAIDYGRSLFEPGIAETTSKAAIQEMAAHFALAEFLVSELDLNTRIWTKDVDESLLQRPDQPKGLMDLPAATVGTLTEKDLWAMAKAGVGGVDDKDEGVDVPRPDRTRIRVGSGAGRTTIRYGLPVSFFLLLLISMAAAAICLSALKSLAATPLSGPFGSVLARLPTAPALDTLIGEYAIAWLVGGAIVGGLMAMGWALRVRRVDVTPDAVRIYRGLRPFPRRYPRPAYGRVVHLKGAVYIGKVESSGLMNPTASPMLSEPEAAWIASALRRALR